MDKFCPEKLKKTFASPLVKASVGLCFVLAFVVALVYYWRVFYSYGQYPFAHITPLVLTGLLGAIGVCGVGVTMLAKRYFKAFYQKAALAIFCVGLLFVFVNPPLQVPDEASHYLRAHSMAQGNFTFDGEKTYPSDVSALMASFSVAWTNAHDGDAIKVRTAQPMQTPAPSDMVAGEAISEAYVQYQTHMQNADALPKVTEPYLFVLLPLVPQAIGICIARLFGFGALGALYGARIANLICYTLLCALALKNCRRYQTVFGAVMLLPLCLFIAGSCSYDGMMLGLYFFAASYYCKDEITNRDAVLFGIAFVLMCTVKINNLLWIALPIVLPQKAWQVRIKKWLFAVCVLGAFVLCNTALAHYVASVRFNFPDVGRTIEGAAPMEQILFMLRNPFRTIAVFVGTLFENDFFVFRLGVFGNTDLSIPVLNVLSALSLCLGATLSVHEKSSLTPRSAGGLFLLAGAYIASVLAGLYVSYTPLGMARVIGLQARYFIPAILMLFVLLAALFSHVLEVRPLLQKQRAHALSLTVCIGFGVYGALLLFQYYFVGPVAIATLA